MEIGRLRIRLGASSPRRYNPAAFGFARGPGSMAAKLQARSGPSCAVSFFDPFVPEGGRRTMVHRHRARLAAIALGVFSPWVMAQNVPAPTPPATAVQVPSGAAATVNDQVVPEKAVARSLLRYPENLRADARPDIIKYLIDNVLLDQEMVRRNVVVDKKDVDSRLEQFRGEIKKDGKSPDAVFKGLSLTEEDLRTQIAADLRWEKFCNDLASEKALRELFAAQPAMFNGSTVRARHILLSPASESPQASAEARARLALIRKQIEEEVARGMAKLAANLDNLKREEARIRLLDAAFSEAAGQESMCPTREQGGDLGWFPRAGKMVEPFAKVAFSLRPFQLSAIVTTAFGHHLILVMDIKEGKPVKLEDARDMVKDIFCDRLRDDLLAKLRPAAKIVVNAAPK
jgi:parvulin-like peptidyl-prolyl isomerase